MALVENLCSWAELETAIAVLTPLRVYLCKWDEDRLGLCLFFAETSTLFNTIFSVINGLIELLEASQNRLTRSEANEMLTVKKTGAGANSVSESENASD